MAGSMSRQNEAKPMFWLAIKAYLACLGFPFDPARKNVLFGHVINLLSSKLVFHGEDGWMLAFSCIVDIGLDFILVLRIQRKNLAFWTFYLWSIKHLFLLI